MLLDVEKLESPYTSNRNIKVGITTMENIQKFLKKLEQLYDPTISNQAHT